MEITRTEEFIQEQLPGRHRFVAEKNGQVIGAVGLEIPQNPRRYHSGDIDVIVHPEHWGSGVATALLNAALDLADNWFNLVRVELEVFDNNPRAISLYELLGFKLEGTKRKAAFGEGSYQDLHVMARLRPPLPEVKLAAPPLFARRNDVTAVSIRPQEPKDAEDLHAIWTHPATARSTNHYPSLELPFYRERAKKPAAGLYRFVAVAEHKSGTQKVVGNINIKQPQNARLIHSAWLGMAVHPDYWRLGIGTSLMDTAIDLADNWIGLKRLSLEVHSDNIGALNLYQKFGFKLEGTKRLYSYGDGRWTDAHFMARLTG